MATDDANARQRERSSDVRPPPETPLPNVYASLASETVYFIRCGRRSVLVDTGYVHNAHAHLANFEAAGMDLSSIAAILITHFHVDHAAGAASVRERLGCPVVAHKNAAPAIEAGDLVTTAAAMPYLGGWNFPFPPCKVDEVVDDGDTLKVDATTFAVVHLPGHTPGCAGYLWDGNMVTGDVLFPGGELGWNDVHWGSNYADVVATMDRIASIGPKYLLPTHGLPFAFNPSDTANAKAMAEHMLRDGHGGILTATQRAPLRAPGETPRKVEL